MSGAIKHGRAFRGMRDKTYSTWRAMRARCGNIKNKKYYLYGAKGIKVCREWQDFNKFLSDMGERPSGFTIDRINGSKGYYKENCRWASQAQQHANRICRGSLYDKKIIELYSSGKSIKKISEIVPLSSFGVYYRLKVLGYRTRNRSEARKNYATSKTDRAPANLTVKT